MQGPAQPNAGNSAPQEMKKSQDSTQAPNKPIAIPSFREVREAQRTTPPKPLFCPSTANAGAGAAGPAVRPPAINALAFVDIQGGGQGGSGGVPSAPFNAQYSAPQQQQQQFQQQQPRPHAPPTNQQPAAYAPRPSYYPPQQHINQHQNTMRPPLPLPGHAGQQPSGSNTNNDPAFNPNVVTVSRRQQGNPVLKYIRNVRWQFGDIIPDFVLGQSTAALFLSLRYHLLKPEYIYSRMKELGRAYRLRVLLVHVDTEDAVEALAQVTKAAIGNEFTLLCGFSTQECARYLETLKSYEKKPAEIIQKDLGTDYVSRANAALTTVRGVNKTDVKTLGDQFGSISSVFQAGIEELKACPGIGPTKARRLHEAFHEPFRRSAGALQPANVPGGSGTAAAAAAVGVVQVQVLEEEENGEEEDVLDFT